MYQFMHVEIFAESVSTKAVTRRTKINTKGKQNNGTKSLLNVRQIIAEAKREAKACPHVLNPQTPTKIYGVDLDEVERLAIASKVGQYDSRNRKLRIDTPILLAGIASYPYDEYKANQKNFKSWLNDNLNWLKKIYGNNLKNVTLHLDETHPHIHFFSVSISGRAKDIHPGHQAESLIDDSDKNARALAYKDGMRKFQDCYFLEVATKHGMHRIGPKKRRMPRAEYKAENANAELLARKIKAIDLIEQEAIENATNESNSILNEAKRQTENMLSNAQKKIKRMQEELLRWNRNALVNMRKLNEAEEKVKKQDAELKTLKEELEFFAQENKELQRKISSLLSKSHIHY